MAFFVARNWTSQVLGITSFSCSDFLEFLCLHLLCSDLRVLYVALKMKNFVMLLSDEDYDQG